MVADACVPEPLGHLLGLHPVVNQVRTGVVLPVARRAVSTSVGDRASGVPVHRCTRSMTTRRPVGDASKWATARAVASLRVPTSTAMTYLPPRRGSSTGVAPGASGRVRLGGEAVVGFSPLAQDEAPVLGREQLLGRRLTSAGGHQGDGPRVALVRQWALSSAVVHRLCAGWLGLPALDITNRRSARNLADTGQDGAP